jgi:hypothetical protein
MTKPLLDNTGISPISLREYTRGCRLGKAVGDATVSLIELALASTATK